jgi:hypothetical protein
MASRTRNVANQSEAPQVKASRRLISNDNGQFRKMSVEEPKMENADPSKIELLPSAPVETGWVPAEPEGNEFCAFTD